MKTVIFFILFAFLTFGQKKQVCFSFDDLPVVNYGMSDTVFQKELFDNLISGLKKNNIPAIGFVNEKKLYNKDGKVNQFQVGLLNNWIDHDLELGNHTFSHPDYNVVSFKDLTQDIFKGEIITKKILSRNEKKIKYFRHPFLHLGNTKEKADSPDRNFGHLGTKLIRYLMNQGLGGYDESRIKTSPRDDIAGDYSFAGTWRQDDSTVWRNRGVIRTGHKIHQVVAEVCKSRELMISQGIQ